MITTIARHECASLCRSPATWIVLALLAAACGVFFLQQVESFIGLQDDLARQDHAPGLTGFLTVRFMTPLTALIGVLGPLFAMRAFSDEFRLETFSLWQSSPVSNTSLAVGKFLGVLFCLGMLLLLVTVMPLSLLALARIDVPVILSAALGLLLCSAACTAIGIFYSSLTRQPFIALVASIATVLVLWLIGNISLAGEAVPFASTLSISTHLQSFFQGYVVTSDIAYFVLVTVLFVNMTIIRLDALRHKGI